MKELRIELDDETFEALTAESKEEKRARKHQVNITLKDHYRRVGRLPKVTK